MEFEVEIVDEMALRTFDLHSAADAEGDLTGFVDMDVNERISWAMQNLAISAWRAAEERTGLR